MIVEIAFDVPEDKKHLIEEIIDFAAMYSISSYVEPSSKYSSLEEVEADCEGK